MFARLTQSTHTKPIADPVCRYFQGGSFALRHPGLKPWAITCSRFAAKSDSLQRFDPGNFVRSRRAHFYILLTLHRGIYSAHRRENAPKYESLRCENL
jgi:hypothetical protein